MNPVSLLPHFVYVRIYECMYVCTYVCIQGVTGGTDQTSGECSLGKNYTDIIQNTYIQS